MDYNTGFCHGDFRQYWQPYYQLKRQHVTPYMPMPVRSVPVDHIRILDMDDRICYRKSKSKATKARDILRKQNFIDRKTLCSGLPFFGLQDDEFQNYMVNSVESREMKMASKLKSAAKTIKQLQTEKQNLVFKNDSLECRLAEETKKNAETDLMTPRTQSEEQIKLQEDLDFEKKRVIKFVSQNVDRQREIEHLRKELKELFHRFECLAKCANGLGDKAKQLEEEKQHLEGLIDTYTRLRVAKEKKG